MQLCSLFNRRVLKAVEVLEKCSVHHTITSHLWDDFMNGNLLQKVREANVFLLCYAGCVLEKQMCF